MKEFELSVLTFDFGPQSLRGLLTARDQHDIRIVDGHGDRFALSGKAYANYCATVMPSLAEEQISKPHNSPDGRLPGREFCWPCMSTSRIIVRKRKSVGE